MIIANLDASEPVNINGLDKGGGIASARQRFDRMMLFPAGLLTHEECDRVRPKVYIELGKAPHHADLPIFLKTHDAWTEDDTGQALLGGCAAASAAILIVRDPRDVVASLANHNGQSIDEAIAFMETDEADLCGRRDRQPNQLRQQLGSWSSFYASWLNQVSLPIHLLRYEDLIANPSKAIGEIFTNLGINRTASAIDRAINFASFERLRGQELANGFREAPSTMNSNFFRQGRSGGWRSELTISQRQRVEAAHGSMMNALGYIDLEYSAPSMVVELKHRST